ncbi:uncharacterized protein LOC124366211 isoform X2 [Homalodisca vitripennis]|uniref:uncharacterized protein LOC124366211 isoform X2 n=1 Tax=Homalodisca vitripennis TaxID=197043 RepID=UPI001EEBD551|nr:uncharacterized protein LOC124366211 isoform X2 [Homalodisca vitripennis]
MPGKYRFQDNWAATHGWNLWLRKGKDIYEGFCSFCNKNIDISVAGVFALKTHVNSKRHSDFQRQLTSGKQITLHSLKSETRVQQFRSGQQFGREKWASRRPAKRNFLKNALQRERNTKVPVVPDIKRSANERIKTADVVSWNTEGKGSPEEIDKLLKNTQKALPDFVLLQNAKLPSAGEGSEHFKWYCSGDLSSAILANKESKWQVKTHNQICNQISVVQAVREEDTNLILISCYIPPATDYHCKDVWDKLVNTLKDIPSNVLLVIGGDFNAQIGQEEKKGLLPASCGHLLYHEVSNENGTKLLKLVKEAHLRIVNTHGPPDSKKDEHFTFKDGEIKTQQDFIFIPVSRTHGYSRNVHLHWVPEYNHAMSYCEIVTDPMNIVVSVNKEEETKVIISTWNIQGATPSKVDKILQEQGLELICVQELFLTSEEDIQSDHYTWLCSKKQWAKNVAILVKKSPDILVKEFTVISENLCVADIVYHHYSVKVISCHLPAKTDPRNEAIATQIEEFVKGIPTETIFVLAGDLGIRNMKNDEEEIKDNSPFWKKLAEETKTNLVSYVWGSNGCPFLTSKIDDLMTITRPFGRRIVFFENSILCSRVSFGKKSAPSDAVIDVEGNLVTRSQTLKTIDGEVYNITTIEYHDPTGDVSGKEAGTVKPSPEDVEKYSKSAPNITELGRILKDFVLFSGVTEQSNSYKSKLQILVMSFLRGNFGKLTTEHMCAMGTKKQGNNMRATSRICWNGIILSETVADGSDQKTLRRQNANFLYSKLGQLFFQVKAKVSFFCKGQPPMLIDDPRYSEIFQKVEKTKYPTMPEVLQYIEDFFTKDSDTELIFGTDFTKDEREEIQMFARIRKLGYRFYASKATEKEADHIVVFIKRTPQYLRDKLIKSKEDLKYVLIPPSVVGENYDSHINKYEQEHFKEEEKLVHNFWKSVRENYRKDSEENQVIKVIKPENTKQESIKQESKNQESVKQRNVKQESKRLGGRNAVSRNTKSTGRFGANKRQYQEYSRFDDPSRFRNDYMQLQNGRHRQVEGI